MATATATTGHGRTEVGGSVFNNNNNNNNNNNRRGEWTSALVGELNARGPGKTRAEMQPKHLAKILWACASAADGAVADGAAATAWAGGDAPSETPAAVEVEVEDSILVNAVRATVRNKEFTASDAAAVLWCAAKLKKAKKGKGRTFAPGLSKPLNSPLFPSLSPPMSDQYTLRV